MNKKIRKAIIPAAGLGTRFLPATKAQPKEMLPIVDSKSLVNSRLAPPGKTGFSRYKHSTKDIFRALFLYLEYHRLDRWFRKAFSYE